MPRATKEPVKNKKNTKSKKKAKLVNEDNNKNDKFSFDEEIVIGLKRIDERPKEKIKPKKTNAKKKKQDDSNIIIKSKYMQNYENHDEIIDTEKKKNSNKKKANNKRKSSSSKKIKQNQTKMKRKKRTILKVIKWLTLLAIVIAGIVYAMLSPIFNIKEIVVNGNSKISSESIISLSELNIDENIFNFRTSNIIEKIKSNAYIDDVQIKRELPDKINITVTERVAKYMLMFGNAYVYINNQGYILEISDVKAELPILIGYSTPHENILEGNRLQEEDLEKLNDVLKIMDAATSSKITDLITQIDISDKSNYILKLEKEKKEIYFGDATNLSTKMLWINKLLKEEKGNEGILYLNMNLNSKSPYFREKV